MKNALKNVDILDQVRVHVYPGTPKAGDRAPVEVFIECVDKTKKVVFDESALGVLNRKLTEKTSTMEARDPRVNGYLQEFVGRMLTELHRNGLVELADIPEGAEDPYAGLRDRNERFKK